MGLAGKLQFDVVTASTSTREIRIFSSPGGLLGITNRVHGTLISQDGQNNFTLHSALGLDEDENTIDPYHVVRRFVGRDIDFKLLLASGWDNNLLVAEKYGERRVFLAGDSAHQYIPTGGYGMNTGSVTRTHCWMLAALVQGWGGPGLLAAYEREPARWASK